MFAGRAVAGITGVAVGVAVALSVAAGPQKDPVETVQDPSSDAPAQDVRLPQRPHRIAPSAEVLLAWSPSGLPAATASQLERLEGVEHATTVDAGIDWIHSARRPDGSMVGSPPPGYFIPFEVAAVKPRAYARFVPTTDRAAILGLRPDELVLAQTAAGLRGAARGLRLDLGGRSMISSGVVSDVATNGYEALMRGPAPDEWGQVYRFVLVRLARANQRGMVERRIKALAGGQPVQIRAAGENPFLRYGDAVLPQMIVKKAFGEFAARPLDDGTIAVDPAWRRRNIRAARVPLLGRVTCHRLLFPQLRGALKDIRERGQGHLVHPRQFGGCYSPRFIGRVPGGRLSHHSWGIAVDINAADNSFGSKPSMDRRIVDVFEGRWGFTWGGRWIVPDGMHFEWQRYP
jgi:hypothetical protein